MDPRDLAMFQVHGLILTIRKVLFRGTAYLPAPTDRGV